ncbi:ankyrin repeat-containing domain protein [Neocallimastix sp. 'constans']
MDILRIDSYVKAIDDKNIDEIKFLQNNNSIKSKDIVFELYNKDLLTSERLHNIVEIDYKYLKVTSYLIKQLLKDDNLKLLDIIFNNFKFFNNEFIVNMILKWKNNIPESTIELTKLIKNYSLSTKKNKRFLFDWNYSSYVYLVNACECGKISLVKYLIEHGLDINKENIQGQSLLFYACSGGNENLVKYLIEQKGADINKEDKYNGETILFNACSSGNENLVKYLIEHGLDINKENYLCETPLFNACFNENENIIKCLIEHGAYINIMNDDGSTPLSIICMSENKNLTKYVIEQGINEDNEFLNEELFKACKYGNYHLVYYLIDYGVDLNMEEDGETPLSHVIRSKDEDLINYVIEHGIKENNEYVKNELLKACKYENYDIVKYLIDYGTDLNIEEDGETPLSIVSRNGNEDLVRYLIEHGAK